MVSVEEGSPSRDPRGPTRFLLRPSSVVFSLTCVLFMYLYVASRESSLPLPRPLQSPPALTTDTIWLSYCILGKLILCRADLKMKLLYPL